MNYGAIKNYDIANGEGVRVSLFVSGCRHHCKGCFQPETWDFDYGQPYTPETQRRILEMLAPDYIAGLTVLGGEPFEPENQPAVLGLMREVKKAYPDKTIWCYTGYTWDTDLMPGGRVFTENTAPLLALIDTLVDGEFVEAEKDLTLRFRGSRNQRLLDLAGFRSGSTDKAGTVTGSDK